MLLAISHHGMHVTSTEFLCLLSYTAGLMTMFFIEHRK